ncbi:YybH family protein [Microbulbifer sp. TRSA001]|uniref:YybH family protein n=1 Tax=Microbulbifer sp. TRSA001 TaxID=3243381 RepID=UPI004039FD1E
MNKASVDEIKSLLSDWAKSTRQDKKDKILENHQPEAVIFDVLAPIKYEGKLAYRKSFDEWQPPFAIPCLFELSELNIHAGDDTGFAHCLINCGGTLPDGKQVKDTVRATFCFVKTKDSWQFAHHHISSPMKVGK